MRNTADLIQFLKGRGCEVSPEEIMDLLWFCPSLDETGTDQEDAPLPTFTPSLPPAAGLRPAAEEPPVIETLEIDPVSPESAEPTPVTKREDTQDEGTGQRDEEKKRAIDFFQKQQALSTGPEVVGRRVTVLEGRALRDPHLAVHALAPLRERRLIDRQGVYDVERMVARYCENGGIWEPWLLRQRKPSFEITLVVEDTPSVLFWHAFAQEVLDVFSRSLRLPAHLLYLSWNSGGQPRLARKRDQPGSPAANLAQPGKRRLILVLTDLTSPACQTGKLGSLLHDWSQVHPTTVLLPFSTHLALRTEFRHSFLERAALDEMGRAQWLQHPGPGELGGRLEASAAPVFFTTLDSRQLREWSRAMCLSGGPGGADALFLPRHPPLASGAGGGHESGPRWEPDYASMLKAFRRSASPGAYGLAEVFAAVPLLPPVMRLVQQALRPKTTHHHLAEFLYSGLIVRAEKLPKFQTGEPAAATGRMPPASSQDPDKVLYDFRQGDGERDLRDLLLDGSNFSEKKEILSLVGQYIRQKFSHGKSFEAFLAGVGGDDRIFLDPELLPFAQVFGRVMERMDAESARRGRVLKEAAAKPQSEPERPETKTNHLGMTLIGCPAGTFQMGSPEHEEGRESESWMAKETLHSVTLTGPFWISDTPVTQGQWRQLMTTSVQDQKALGNDYGEVTGQGDDHPMYFVNWEEALRFCDRLTEAARAEHEIGPDQAYSLPTEAQWEYACRAETTGPYAGSDLDSLGWYGDNSGGGTHPVRAKAANPWRIYDFHGNVWEWCADWYVPDLGSAAVADPQGLENGGRRVLRGGSWDRTAQDCRSAYRGGGDPGDRVSRIGFRPVLTSRGQRAKLGELAAALETEAQPEPQEQTEAARRSPAFVPVKAGTFLMGSPPDEEGRSDRETLHQVTLTQDFEMAETPVTQSQWEAVMGNNPSDLTASGPDAPVEKVSWEDATAYCAKLTEADEEGWIYTLPAEAQWECACRAGTSGPFNVEQLGLEELGWFGRNSGFMTHAVKQKAPNALGLYDMHGNVFEWCLDWFQEDLGSAAVADPQGPADGEFRVIRGGGWSDSAQYCRSAYRDRGNPGYRNFNIGFRPVRRKKAEGTALESGAKPETQAGTRSEALRARDFEAPGVPGMKMLCLEHGNFTMGEGESARPVTLSEDFFIAETPVTQGQWQAVMGNNPSHFTTLGPDAPVETVSWDDARSFCEKLNQVVPLAEGWHFTLPTEAQWEYACRAGTTTAFSWGEEWEEGRANVSNSVYPSDHKAYFESRGLPTESTMPVKTFGPNPWGLYDVHGNVWEWCADWYGALGRVAATDPQGPANGHYRVIRGGCWDGSLRICRSAYRFRSVPGNRDSYVGFRPVLARQKPADGTGPESGAKPETQAGARSPESVAADFTNNLGLQMLCLPPGEFVMGSPADEPGREPAGAGKETQHRVTLTEAFWLAKTPVTQAAWQTVMGTGVAEQKAKGSSYGEVTGTGGNHPMYFVNWKEALQFCDALTQRERREGRLSAEQAYSLPTETQWEYACRAGTTGPYAGETLDEMGWYTGNSRSSIQPVGQKAANPWGLQDMHGNVWEWCADCYVQDLGGAAATDPQGPGSGESRVFRGGGWYSVAQGCRSASRSGRVPDDRSLNLGFRPVLTSQAQRAKLGELTAEPEPAPRHEAEAQDTQAGEQRSGPAGMTFVTVPPGSFLMGSPPDEEGREPQYAGKETQHPVTLTQEFEMAETPVTQAQWKRVMGNNPSHFKPFFGGDKLPVEQVSWEDAKSFCAKLTEQDANYAYDLPTEAQWEYACRAGTEGPYNIDGTELKNLGWFEGNSGNKTHPVKEKKPNAWGLYDTHGNVWEWCDDWYSQDLGSAAVIDPKGPESGELRVFRGGCCDFPAQECRSAHRHWYNPVPPDGGGVGFRPVRRKKA